jgi:diguanylate cyclase
MKNDDQFEDAIHVARTAIGLMTLRRVPPTPRNYAVWDSFVRGADHGLKHAINDLVAAGTTFTQEINDELHERFVSSRNDEIRKVGKRMELAVEKVIEQIGKADKGALRYGAALESFSDALDSGRGTQELAEAASSILAETQVIMDINGALERHLESSAAEIFRLRAELDDSRQAANTDSLTGILNRKGFDETLDDAIRVAVKNKAELSLLMIDIDHFKKFNDAHGHPMGDQVLRLMGRALSALAGPSDLPARYGGEEFSFILPGKNGDEARIFAETIRRAFSAQKIHDRRKGTTLGKVTLSIGAATLRQGADDAEALISRADSALYAAKNGGRDRVCSENDVKEKN